MSEQAPIAPIPVEQLKQQIDAARDSVQFDRDLRDQYSSYQPSQEALNRGADWGKSELIGDGLSSTGSVVRTEHGTKPDYFNNGVNARSGYEVAGADVNAVKPNGERVMFSTRRDPNTRELVTSHYKSNRDKYGLGETLADKDGIKNIGGRVVSLAARQVVRQNTPNRLANV